jgi:predicted secreted protein
MLLHLGRLARALVFFSTIWFILATPLLAEDIAHRRIIGFSPGGDYFAFEQSGIENGSGEAYAHIFIIDTHENKWVKGSPFRASARGPRKLQKARRRVRRQARDVLDRYRIRRKGVVLASNPITELNANPHRVAVRTRRTIRRLDAPLIFSIEEIRIPTRRCRRYTSRPIKGMIIRVRRKGGRLRILHEDSRIPRSRGCPTSYGIEDVIRLKKSGGGAVYAVIYSFIRSGPDGEERRFIAGGWHDDGGDYEEPEHYRDLYDYYGGENYDSPRDRDYDSGSYGNDDGSDFDNYDNGSKFNYKRDRR